MNSKVSAETKFAFLCLVGFLGNFMFISSASAECYSYDQLGRLIGVKSEGVGTSEVSYTLDAHGNRTQVDASMSSSETCAAADGITTSGVSTIPAYDVADEEPSASGNSAPLADDETIAVIVSSNRMLTPLTGDEDPDGDAVFLASVTGSSSFFTHAVSGDTVSITAGANSGSGTLSYSIVDVHGATSSATITVNVIEGLTPIGDPCEGNEQHPDCEL